MIERNTKNKLAITKNNSSLDYIISRLGNLAFTIVVGNTVKKLIV